jgi:DNA modification methylase
VARQKGKLSELKQDPQNARKHSAENRAAIERSIERYGAGRSVVAARDMTLLGGNATAEAAKAAGIDRTRIVETDGTELVVVVRTDIEPGSDAAVQLAIADNKTAESATWDHEMLAVLAKEHDLSDQFSDREWRRMVGYQREEIADLDVAPDLPASDADTRTALGDVWVLGSHRLAIGSAADPAVYEALLSDGPLVDLVWTDPPYGVAIGDKNRWLNSVGKSNRIERNLENDTLDEDALRTLLHDSFGLMAQYTKPGGCWYVAAPAGPLHLIWGSELQALGIWRQTIQWVKSNATFSPMGVSYHWQAEPIFYGWVPVEGATWYEWDSEPVFYGWKPGGAHEHWGGRKQTTVWEIPRPSKSKDHPTMKPVELVARAIENSTVPGDVIFDGFGGSGTTIVAAQVTGRSCYLVELDPRYGDVILQRWEKATGLSAVRALTGVGTS